MCYNIRWIDPKKSSLYVKEKTIKANKIHSAKEDALTVATKIFIPFLYLFFFLL